MAKWARFVVARMRQLQGRPPQPQEKTPEKKARRGY
jgi:hypothetical protein